MHFVVLVLIKPVLILVFGTLSISTQDKIKRSVRYVIIS